MKSLLKLSALVLLTKFMVSTPQGVHPELDVVRQVTVSDVAEKFNVLLVQAEKLLALLN